MAFWIPLAMAAMSAAGSYLSSKGQKEGEVRQADTLTPEQKEFLQRLYSVVNKQAGSGVSAYPGTTTYQSPLLQQFIEGQGGADNWRVNNVLNQALSMEPLYGEDPEATRQYWQESYYDPMMKMFKEETLPQIREDYAGAGAYRSGGRYRAEVGATEDLMTNLSGTLADLMWQERTAARGEQEGAVNRAMQGIGLSYLPWQQLYQAGGIEQAFGEAPLQEEYQKWLYQQPYNNPWLNYGIQGLQTQGTQPYMYQPQPSWYSQLGNTMMSVGGQGFGSWLGGMM